MPQLLVSNVVAIQSSIAVTSRPSRDCLKDAAIQTWGGYGYVSDLPVDRIVRGVQVCQIYEGTFDAQKIIIQRALG